MATVELPAGYTIADIMNMSDQEKVDFWNEHGINPYMLGSLREIVVDQIAEDIVNNGTKIEDGVKHAEGKWWGTSVNQDEVKQAVIEKKEQLTTNKDTTEIKKTIIDNKIPSEFYKHTYDTEKQYHHDNVLHKFASFNYLWTLSAISETEVRNPDTIKTNPVHDVIARTGGIGEGGKFADEVLNVSEFAEHPVHKDAYERFSRKQAEMKIGLEDSNKILKKNHDIYFEKVVINGIHGPNEDKKLMNYTNIEFELSEPLGVTLYEKLRAAAGNCGYVDHLDAPFLLTLEFIGYDSQGNVVKGSELGRGMKKKWPIKIVDSTVDINQGGSKYTMTAMPWTEFATVNRFNYVRAPITIQGVSLKHQISSFVMGLDHMQDTEVEKQVREIKDDYRITYDPYYDYTEVEAGEDPMTWWDIGKFTLDEEYQDTVFVNPNDPTKNVKSSSMLVPERGSIPKTLELMMMRTEAYKNLAEILLSGGIKNAEWEKLQGMINDQGVAKEYVPWFKIVTSVYTHPNEFDRVRKRNKKTLHYHIQPYLVHIGNFTVPGWGGAGQWGKLVKKKYDYIFTGQNLDILDLNINYKYAFFQARLYSDSDTAHDNRQLEKFASAQETKWFGKGGMYPDSVFPLTGEPVLGGSGSVGARESMKSASNETRQFYDYLTNPLADMIKVNMTVMGDPAWLGHDSALPIPFTPDYDQLNPVFPSIKPGVTKGFSFSQEEEAFNLDEAEPLCTLNFKFPTDFDEKSGFYKLSKQDTASFSGLYKVVEVDSIFEQGQFKQELLMIRIKNQGGDEKSAHLTVKKTTNNKLSNGVHPYSANAQIVGNPHKIVTEATNWNNVDYNEKVDIVDLPINMNNNFIKHKHWYTENENGERTWHYEAVPNDPTKGFY